MIFRKQEKPAPAPTPGKLGGKGRPTPSRREQEAKRKRPLVPEGPKARREMDRLARREMWKRQQQALLTGDERYLPYRDKGPVRRFARNYVDARFCLGEVVLPVLLLVMVAMLVISRFYPRFAFISVLVLYGIVLVALADSFVVVWGARRRMLAKFDREKIPGFTNFYVFSRTFLPRPLRSPRPQVQRGQYPS